MALIEKTLVLVKPDGVQRGLIGEIVARFERKGLRVRALKMMQADEALARRHYAEHVEKPFFKGLSDFITSAPLVAMVVAGPGAVDNVRQIDDGRDRPGQVGAGNDPRRPRPDHRDEPDPRLGLAGAGRG